MFTAGPVALSGPLFVVVIVYVSVPPPLIGSVASVTPTETSDAGLTVIVALPVLSLPLFGSNSLRVTVALLLIVPTVVAFSTSVIVAFAPEMMPPRLQVTGPVPLQEPCDGVAALNDALLNVSMTCTPVAFDRPLLVIVSVIVAV